jgi:hypothetical protein
VSQLVVETVRKDKKKEAGKPPEAAVTDQGDEDDE